MSSSGRVAKNTVVLYVRMMIVMFINLFTVRIVLNALGEEDYGIYNVIGGVITMLSGVTSVLAAATQRFYSYALGEKKAEGLTQIFSASFNIYIIVSAFVIIIGETIGLWFVNSQLVIPDSRLAAANWIYQFSILSFVLSMLQSPFSSAVIAHEDMGVFALVSFCECVFKFGAAWLLLVSPIDRLTFHGALILLVYIFSFSFYYLWGRLKYAECHYRKVNDRKLYKELFSFSGWTLFGSLAGVGMSQVNTLLVNIFFGPIANAARAIAIQINGALNSFSGNFIMAVRPPMIKAYAEGDFAYLNRLFTLSNKFIYYCMLFIALPLLFEMNTILNLWLKTASQQTVVFSQLIVIYAVILSLNNPISIIMQAAGKVKEYYVPVESFTLLCPVATYVLFKLGLPAESTFWAMIGAIILSHCVRIWCIRRYYSGFSLRDYVVGFIIPAGLVTILSSALVYIISTTMAEGVWRLIIILFASFLIVAILAIILGLNKLERQYLKVTLISKFRRSNE